MSKTINKHNKKVKTAKKENKLLLVMAAITFSGLASGQVGVNTKAPEATLDVRGKNDTGANSTSVPGAVAAKDGILVPRVSDLAANGSVNGQLVYLVADAGSFIKGFYYWNGSAWTAVGADTTNDAWVNDATNTLVKLGAKADGSARTAGTDFVAKDNGNVGVGNTGPLTRLDTRTNPGNSSPGEGSIGVGETTADASAAGAGGLRYSTSSGGQLQYSNGIVWNTLTSTAQKCTVVAKKSSSQNLPDQTTTNVSDWSEIADVNNNFDPVTGIFTAPRTGNYSVSFSYTLSQASVNASSFIEAQIIKTSGSTTTYLKSTNGIPVAGTSYFGSTISFVVNMQANDSIRPAIYQYTGSSKSLRVGSGNDDGFVNISIVEL